jgi:hypothetical protein
MVYLLFLYKATGIRINIADITITMTITEKTRYNAPPIVIAILATFIF